MYSLAAVADASLLVQTKEGVTEKTSIVNLYGSLSCSAVPTSCTTTVARLLVGSIVSLTVSYYYYLLCLLTGCGYSCCHAGMSLRLAGLGQYLTNFSYNDFLKSPLIITISDYTCDNCDLVYVIKYDK